jgi:hypothetical protein
VIPMTSPSRVMLYQVGSFTRRSAADYSWKTRVALPEQLSVLCESMPGVASQLRAYPVIVSETEGALWVAQSAHAGQDEGGRPVICVSVWRTDVAPLPGRSTWPAIAAAISRAAPAVENVFALDLAPASVSDRVTLEPFTRAALGIGVAVDLNTAVALLTRAESRFSSICFVNNPVSATHPAPWLALLAVNFAPAAPGPDDRMLLDWAHRLALSERDVIDLLALPTAEARAAVAWAAEALPERPPEFAGASASLVKLMVRLALAKRSRSQILAALVRDVPTVHLSLDVVSALAPTLGAESAALLVSRGASTASPNAWRELSDEDLLVEETLIPTTTWMGDPGLVRAAKPAAEIIMRRHGISDAAIAWIQDEVRERPSRALAGTLVSASRIAAGLGLTAPRNSLRQWLSSVSSLDELREWSAVADTWSGWTRAVAAFLDRGELPPARMVDPPEWAAAIACHRAVYRDASVVLSVLPLLTAQERFVEAEMLLDLPAASSDLVTPVGGNVLRAKWERGAPPVVRRVQDVAGLLARRVITLDDFVPENIGVLRELAAADEQVAALILPIVGGSGVPPVHGAPAAWKKLMQDAFTDHVAREWLSTIQPSDQPAALRWVAALHDVPAAAMLWVTGEGVPDVAALQDKGNHRWLRATLAVFSRQERLDRLRQIATSRAAHLNETLAIDLIHLAVPDLGDEMTPFVTHALTGLGPMPTLDGLALDVIARFAEEVDAIALVNALMASRTPRYVAPPEAVEAIVTAVRKTGKGCPEHGYTRAQMTAQAALTTKLCALPNWEQLNVDPEALRAWLHDLLRTLDVDAASLVTEANPSPERRS